MKRALIWLFAICLFGGVYYFKHTQSVYIDQYNDAVLNMNHDNFQAAIPVLEKLLEDRPEDIRVLDALAYSYHMHGDTQKSAEFDRRILKLDPGNMKSRKRLEQAAIESGRR
jgi:Flp pilus assembly protein TadD